MNWFADIALQIWPPIVLVLFLVMPARRAVVGALIASWLFLPQHFIEVTFVPNLTKVSATSYALLFGALLLDPRRSIFNFRPVWTDIPMGLFMFSGFLSSLFNGLGTYDAFSMLLDRFVQYGIPYLMGRSYFQTAADCKELCLGILLGGLVYVPLCAYEIRMSPQLHAIFYGAAPFSDFKMAVRWGGFRPSVFMQHGLMVGVWMATACATSFWLWRTRAVEKFLWMPMWAIFWGLLVTTVLVKATGAIVLLFGVIGIMYFLINLRSKLPFAAVLVVIPSYLFIRTTGLWDGIAFSEWLGTQVSPDRAASLWYRLTMENETVGRMTNRGMFGWGGWGRAFDFTFDLKGVPTLIVPDSFWIVTFGSNGYYGLITVFLFYLLGPAVLLYKLSHREWADPRYASITGIAIVSLLYALDCLFNAMVNPIFIVMLGAVSGMAARLERKPASAASSAKPAAKPASKPVVRTARTASERYLPPGRPQPSEGRP